MIGGAVVSNGRVYVASGLSYIMGHPDNHFHALVLPGDSAIKNKQTGGMQTGPLDPTFKNVYQSIIAKSCIQSQCHGSTQQGLLFMGAQAEAYKNLVGIMAQGVCTDPMNMSPTCACGMSGKTRVVAGQPDQSLLVEKVGGNPKCGDRMPPTGDVLRDDQQKLIKDWISAGAKNDG